MFDQLRIEILQIIAGTQNEKLIEWGSFALFQLRSIEENQPTIAVASTAR